jgi:hypothetical protein
MAMPQRFGKQSGEAFHANQRNLREANLTSSSLMAPQIHSTNGMTNGISANATILLFYKYWEGGKS